MSKYLNLALLIAWMGVIFFFSAQSGLSVHENPPLSFYLERKGAHVFEYLVLAFLLFRTFHAYSATDRKSLLLLASGLSILYALSDELHQTFVPGREGKLSDVLIDGIGIALFVLGYALWKRSRKASDS